MNIEQNNVVNFLMLIDIDHCRQQQSGLQFSGPCGVGSSAGGGEGEDPEARSHSSGVNILMLIISKVGCVLYG